jgi:glucose/mannose transport system substrate-binding protein
MNRKWLVCTSLLVIAALLMAACAPAAPVTTTDAPTEAPEEETDAPEAPDEATEEPSQLAGTAYTFAAGDTLADLAEANFGNSEWSWAIYGLTNLVHLSDPAYAQISNPDDIAEGAQIYIPGEEEAAAFMENFDPTNPDLSMLFPTGGEGQILVGNYWTSGGEFAGINGIYDLYREQYPGVEIVHAGVAGGAGLNFQSLALTKLQGGDPFDVMQMHVGKEALLYNPEEYLTPLEDLVNETQGDVMPEDLKNLLTLDGHIYTLPLNIHRGNVLWINKQIFADNGLTPPTTFDEFFEVADALQAEGIVPLAMGGANQFEQVVLFETVLIGVLGPDDFMGLWSGDVPMTDPRVTEALETYKRMLTYTNEDRDALSWDQATKLVIEGQAAMNIMGDWANGEFKNAGKTADDYEGIPAPGNAGVFDMVSDSFAMPLQAPNQENAMNFLRLITTKEAQEVFNINKGSICARTDCDYSDFDAYLQSSAADFQNSRVVASAWANEAIIPSWAAAINNIIIKFSADGDVEAAQAALVQAAEEALSQ